MSCYPTGEETCRFRHLGPHFKGNWRCNLTSAKFALIAPKKILPRLDHIGSRVLQERPCFARLFAGGVQIIPRCHINADSCSGFCGLKRQKEDCPGGLVSSLLRGPNHSRTNAASSGRAMTTMSTTPPIGPFETASLVFGGHSLLIAFEKLRVIVAACSSSHCAIVSSCCRIASHTRLVS